MPTENPSANYPKPGRAGGRLIREVIALLRNSGVDLPITSHIHLALSGGSDSLALAQLLVRYGRRIAPKSRFRVLHINHGWRGESSAADEKFVRAWAKVQGVPLKVVRLKSPTEGGVEPGESWEERARRERKEIYQACKGVVLTAHQANDLAETLLWRLFTGSAETHGGGIAVVDGNEIRPLLRVEKRELEAFLREEEQPWLFDETNYNPRFLRARMRTDLMPTLLEMFPRAVEHLARAALDAQARVRGAGGDEEKGLAAERRHGESARRHLFGAAGLRLRRGHWTAISKAAGKSGWRGELHLPGGWKLVRQKPQERTLERWVLEKLSQ